MCIYLSLHVYFDPVCIRENPEVIKDVCCPIIRPWKKDRSKKSLRAQNYNDVHAHLEYM